MKKYRLLYYLVSVVLLGATVFVCVYFSAPPLREEKVKTYLPLFEQNAATYGLSLSDLLAIANAESGFEPDALSHAGAVGLMQVMPATARWIAEANGLDYAFDMLYDPAYNVRVASLYLVYLGARFDGEWVYAAYNAGEGAVSDWLAAGIGIADIPYRETAEYVTKVRKLSKRYVRRGYSIDLC